MEFERLPDIPESWRAFLRGSMPFLPASKSISALIASAEAVRNRGVQRDVVCRYLDGDDVLLDGARENMRKLQRPESVVVLANYYPSLFGGPAFQLFKCMTAIRICEELARHGLEAVPVCWIGGVESRFFSKWSIRIANAEFELNSLGLTPPAAGDVLPFEQTAALLARIEELGRGEYDPETLGILGASFGTEKTLSRATARLAAELMKPWSMVVVDPSSLDLGEAAHAPSLFALQSSALPVIATVIDPMELDSFAAAHVYWSKRGSAGSMAWPQASATIVDGRSRRILNRYGLELDCLFEGSDAIAGRLLDSIPRDVPERLMHMKQNADSKIAAMRALAREGTSMGKRTRSSEGKIAYQLDRLRAKFEAARVRKEETVRRHMWRVCNALAPERRIQEMEIAAVQLPLRYSSAILGSLCRRLDIFSLEHQLLYLD